MSVLDYTERHDIDLVNRGSALLRIDFLDHKAAATEVLIALRQDNGFCTEHNCAAVISTCHRFELVSANRASAEARPQALAHSVQGAEQVVQRLSAVAAGLESKILGEIQIFRQASRGLLSNASDPVFAALERLSTGIAYWGLRQFDLAPMYDWATIPSEVIKRRGHRAQDVSVVVVGSGSLATSIIETVYHQGFQAVHARSWGRAGCAVPGLPAGAKYERPGQSVLQPYILVIATDPDTPPYMENVMHDIQRSSCIATINLGARCKFPTDLDVINLDSADILPLFAESNASLANGVERARSAISNTCRELFCEPRSATAGGPK